MRAIGTHSVCIPNPDIRSIDIDRQSEEVSNQYDLFPCDNQAMIKKIASDWFHFVVESKKEIAMEVKSQEERNATLEQVAANLRTKSWIQNQQ